MSSDSSGDEEDEINFVYVPKESVKDKLYINHSGRTPMKPGLIGSYSKKNFLNSKKIWNGTLIYDIQNEEACLKPPTDSSDSILRFNSKFESGNLHQAYKLKDTSYHLVLEYDQNKEKSCQWFYFQITNTRKSAKYRFYITGFHNSSMIYKKGSKILWYSEKRAKEQNLSWSRGGKNYYYDITVINNDGKRSTVKFDYEFLYDNDIVYFAFSVPYTYSDLLRSISNWEASYAKFIKVETFCKTLAGRDCPILTITNHDFTHEKKYIFITARVHPGESNGSVACHGLIDFLFNGSVASSYLLKNVVFKIIPMLNVDGVVEGLCRCGLSQTDLNRVWSDPNPVNHPVIYHTKEYIKQLQQEHGILLYLDFHGHARLHGVFIFGCPDLTDNVEESEQVFPRLLSYLSDQFTWSSCTFNIPNERRSSSRVVLRNELGITHSYTIESSFGAILVGTKSGFLYNEYTWKEIGMKCGEAMYHLLLRNSSPLTKYIYQEICTEFDNEDRIDKPFSDVPCEFQTESSIVTQPKIQIRETQYVVVPDSKIIYQHSDISDTPPKQVTNRWNHMQFKPIHS